MKKICLLIIFFTITLNLSAQIITDSVQGINCYNDTGLIALDVDVNSLSIQWEYSKDTIINLIDTSIWLPSSLFSFIYLNSPLMPDTLKTIQCQKNMDGF